MKNQSVFVVGLAILLVLGSSPVALASPIAYNGGPGSASLAGNQWAYFEVTTPSVNEGWRLTLNATGPADPNLYVLRSTANPTTSTSTKASAGETTDTLTFTAAEATPDDNSPSYAIDVHLPSGATESMHFTLTSENHYVTTFTWDPGTTVTGRDLNPPSNSMYCGRGQECLFLGFCRKSNLQFGQVMESQQRSKNK